MGRDPKADDFAAKASKSVLGFEHTAKEYEKDKIALISVSIRMPTFPGGEFFLVGRFRKGNKRVVAFRSGSSFYEVLVGFEQAMKYKALNFREDKYGEGND